jgi:branched-subunit amino acid aminotransferase/4-amino-4-deoxychorismate lyase
MTSSERATNFASWTWNGEAFAPAETVPIGDRGFRYGMSLFESIRLLAGEPHFLQEHLRRLQSSCEACGFSIPRGALEAIDAQLRTSTIDGLARIYVTAGDGAPTAPAGESRVYVFIEPRSPSQPGAYDITVAEEAHHPLLGGLKTGNYWSNLEALQRALATGRQEALLFNERAELVSGCMSNAFVVCGGKVRTPALHCGAREGVMRERVLHATRVEECSLFIKDLLQADEVFLTSSWIGVRPVARLNERKLPSRTVAESLAHIAVP